MGSPLSQHPAVQELIQKIGERDVDYLEGLRGQRNPSPTHLMFACSTVLGEGGQENLSQMMKQVPGKQRRDRFIDIAIQLAQAEDEGAPEEAPVKVSQEPPVEAAPVKKKRRRRTKAEMEAAREAEAEAAKQVEADFEQAPAIEGSFQELIHLIKEQSKAVFELDTKINELDKRVNLKIDELVRRINLCTTGTDETIKLLTDQAQALTALKEGLVAAELDLVMNGKLAQAAISETIEANWPSTT